MKASVLITGCEGGIGRQLMDVFRKAGWETIGLDRTPSERAGAPIIACDIAALASEADVRKNVAQQVRARCADAPLRALINNAAIQHIAGLDALDDAQIVEMMNVNAIAPMLLAKIFLPELQQTSGVVINVGSVHARATKPGFSGYAASKAAMHGVTRALAVDLGPKVRVVTLAPAAVATDMLKAGFEHNADAYRDLETVHPAGRIATPEEIARLALYLTTDDAAFLTGATIYADGGILSRLHDPE